MSKSSSPTGKSFAESTPHFVYRAFDAEGRLLYIGVSTDVERRIKSHRGGSCFGPLIASVESSDPIVGWSEAHRIELAAVHAERPLHNIEGAHPEALTYAKDSHDAFLLERHQRRLMRGAA